MTRFFCSSVLALLATTAFAAPDPGTFVPCSNPVDHEVASLKSATVRVQTHGGSGSGVVISESGWVLTAAHVVAPDTPVSVVTHDGIERVAELVRWVPSADAALLRIALPDGVPCASLASAPPATGSVAVVIGSPMSDALDFSVTRGIVSGVRKAEGRNWVQTDAAVNPGNSGGPLFGSEGQVAGVVSFKLMGNAEGLAFALETGSALAELGVSAGDADSVTPYIEAAEDPYANAVIRMEGDPDGSGAMATKKPCRHAEIEIDPFDGHRRLSVYSNHGYFFRYTGDEVAQVRFYYALAAYNRASDMTVHLQSVGIPDTVDLRMRLADGRRVVAESIPLGAEKVSNYYARYVVRLDLPPEVVAAIAESPAEVVQWDVGGERFNFDLSDNRSAATQMRNNFTCLAQAMPGEDGVSDASDDAAAR